MMPIHILTISGYLLLFAWVAAEQGGLPLPAALVLVAAGALSAGHASHFWLALVVGMCGALVADTTWFVFGRRYGHGVMRLICRLSLEPATCVRRTQDFIALHPLATLTIAKFVPGFSTLAAPAAGQSKMRLRQFLVFDGMGSALWVGAFLAAGYLGRDPDELDSSLAWGPAVDLPAWNPIPIRKRHAVPIFGHLVQEQRRPAECSVGHAVHLGLVRNDLFESFVRNAAHRNHAAVDHQRRDLAGRLADIQVLC